MESNPSMPFTFRPATTGDESTIEALFKEHLASLGYAPDPELDADMADPLASYSGPGNTFLLVHGTDGRPAGMGGIRGGEIRRIYLRPECRGRGFARGLVLRLLQAAIDGGQPAFRAVISRHNEYMRQVFQACGFLPTGLTPDHLKMRDCEILLLARPNDPARPVMVITGGSRGLGRHLVGHFAGRFNVVFGWWNSEEAAFELAREQAARGHWVWPLRCDVREWRRVQFLADMVRTVAGPCQFLLHTTGRFSLKPLAGLDPATWRDELDSTVTAGFHAWRAFAEQLKGHARSRLVFIGDSAAEQLRARRQSTAYYIGKHGLVLLARTIAAEQQQTGLTCNVVSPGVMPNSVDLDQPGMKANVEFDEVAGVIDFLLGTHADAVSGSNLIASRGWNL
jgi:3-oxoacyl-[acyl-carrier protein] reductase